MKSPGKPFEKSAGSTSPPLNNSLQTSRLYFEPGSRNQLYQRMIQEIEDYAILLLEPDGTIMSWNRGAQLIKGYSENEAIGSNFRIFYTIEDREARLPESLLDTAARTGKAAHEGWRLKKDGSKFWGSIVITALHGEDGAIIGYSKLTRDLTERKMAEERQQRYALELQYKNEQLRRSEERFHRMISEVEDYAIILLDSGGRILNWNKGAEKIKGYREAEVIGHSFSLFYLPEDREDGLPDKLLEIARREGKATHEGWRMRKDGTHFWASVVITTLHDEWNDIIGFSKVTRDLTQKKKADEQIQIQNQQLQEYAYVASHDLQEPLRKIQMFSYLLKENSDDRDSVLRNIDRISSAADRMSALISDVLNYAQAEDHEDLFEAVDLNEVLRQVQSDFELLLQQREGQLVIGELPTIHAIPIQMHQLFANLISNAIKFSDNAPIIKIFPEYLPSGKFSIAVQDNGIGFDPIYAEKIFKMFQRANSDRKGTGIGLALCKKIIENHGGTISVMSKPGKGTKFTLSFGMNAG